MKTQLLQASIRSLILITIVFLPLFLFKPPLPKRPDHENDKEPIKEIDKKSNEYVSLENDIKNDALKSAKNETKISDSTLWKKYRIRAVQVNLTNNKLIILYNEKYEKFTTSIDSLNRNVIKMAINDVRDTNSWLKDSISFGEIFSDKAGILNIEVKTLYELYKNHCNKEQVLITTDTWWDKFVKYGGILAFIWLLLRSQIEKIISEILYYIRKKISNKLLGNKLFRRIAIRRYKEFLIDQYDEIKSEFRSYEKPLEHLKAYIPIKFLKGDESVDAQMEIGYYKRVMITGVPGAGKSQFLKHIALSYAKGSLGILQDYTPILIELNRMNDYTDSLYNLIVDTLTNSNFPKSKNFISEKLKNNKLLLLFDGLDEVTKKRSKIVQEIKDLLNNNKSRAIITCRSAVYLNEFAQDVDQTYNIREFEDRQIQLYLNTWQKYFPGEKKNLMDVLDEKPLIKELARNPLLLTMIANLYCEKHFVLPYSRSDFYKQAVELLLWERRSELNNYSLIKKQSILMHLALFNQDASYAANDQDTSLEYKTVINKVKELLINISATDVNPEHILDEIIDRSGLLLKIDGGSRYKFTHLTLQEYFAALALRGDTITLLNRYRKDKSLWRETLKLWCGLTNDCTELIQQLFEFDKVFSLECLADAHMVDPDLAKKIIEYFYPKLEESENVAKAFAAIVADLQSKRSKDVFDFLLDKLKNGSAIQRQSAAKALSFTNLRKAAEVLSKYYYEDFIRLLLVRMGDIAVDPLIKLLKEGKMEILNDLQEIGTPKVARTLVPFLWSSNQSVSSNVALTLANLTSHNKDIEDVLSEYLLDKEHKKSPKIEWIWDPFIKLENSNLSNIMGRISWLILRANKNDIHNCKNLDARITIPLFLVKTEETGITGYDQEEMKVTLNSLKLEQKEETKRKLLIAPFKNCNEILTSVFNLFSIKLQIQILNRLIEKRHATVDDWKNINRQSEFLFEKSYLYYLSIILIISIPIIFIVDALFHLGISNIDSYLDSVLISLVVSLIIFYFFYFRKEIFTNICFIKLLLWGYLMLVILLPFDLIICLLLCHLELLTKIIISSIILTVFLIIDYLSIIKQWKAQNPIYGILDFYEKNSH